MSTPVIAMARALERWSSHHLKGVGGRWKHSSLCRPCDSMTARISHCTRVVTAQMESHPLVAARYPFSPFSTSGSISPWTFSKWESSIIASRSESSSEESAPCRDSASARMKPSFSRSLAVKTSSSSSSTPTGHLSSSGGSSGFGGASTPRSHSCRVSFWRSWITRPVLDSSRTISSFDCRPLFSSTACLSKSPILPVTCWISLWNSLFIS
mmetsp:Transcript_42679/g.135603  ORF Transcript_42679/g.135603 Transcript_42679/m.135603 type:complete len:211 (-) Transcript_42679:631-1263(-)